MNSPSHKWHLDGWRGITFVALTYVYFLIFAQFGFLKRLADFGIAGSQLKLIMAAMAAGGVLMSLLAHRLENLGRPERRLQIAFAACAASALLTLLPLNLTSSVVCAFFIGASVGLLTVTLVTHLRSWIGDAHPLIKVGTGTGLAYAVCNFPPLFTGTSRTQTIVAIFFCLIGIAVSMLGSPALQCADSSELVASALTTQESQPITPNPAPFLLALACFTALVWFDSAAFFIIQNTPALKSGTWEGAGRLWQNGAIHIIGALAGGILLSRRGFSVTVSAAFGSLALACLMLATPGQASLSTLLYPFGVSLYSTALVAYPAYLCRTQSSVDRARKVGVLYAVAGWIGSGLGIGMAENLGHVPVGFTIAAALVFLAPWLWQCVQARRREVSVTAALLAAAFVVNRGTSSPSRVPESEVPKAKSEVASVSGSTPLIERGRQVYIAEGCIHCHSQYVRPGSIDELMWGPASEVESVKREQPPLIGNRRQGPDLTQVGNRRTSAWLRAHFLDPVRVSHVSPMPSYAHLFSDERGDALLAYVKSLGQSNLTSRLRLASSWKLSEGAIAHGSGFDGATLLQRHCATCHSPDGAARRDWPGGFLRPPPDFITGPFVYAPPAADAKWRLHRLAEIIKFGLPATEMPGHEYLPDEQVAAMAEYLIHLSSTKSMQTSRASSKTIGDSAPK